LLTAALSSSSAAARPAVQRHGPPTIQCRDHVNRAGHYSHSYFAARLLLVFFLPRIVTLFGRDAESLDVPLEVFPPLSPKSVPGDGVGSGSGRNIAICNCARGPPDVVDELNRDHLQIAFRIENRPDVKRRRCHAAGGVFLVQ